MTGGFVAAVVAIVLLIVAATPEYDRPAVAIAGVPLPGPSSSPNVTPVADPSAELDVPSPAELTGYRWPLRAARVLTWFGPSKDGFIRTDDGRIHEGIDLASRCEAQVTAAHKGTVVAAGRAVLGEVGFEASRGQIADLHRRHISKGKRDEGEKDVLPITVVIDDGNGYRSVYKHFAEVSVKAGDAVKAGTVIGLTGQTGGVSRCQVQYELVRWADAWQRVAESEMKRVGYPKWIRERVDPLLVLALDAKGAPKASKRNPPPEGSMPARQPGTGAEVDEAG